MSVAEIDEDRRPLVLVFVYTWDVVRALLALLAAVVSFGGAVMVGTRVVDLPLWQQLLYATSAASYGAALFVIGVLMPRRAAWVRRAQITVFSISATLAVTSQALQVVVDPQGVDAGVLAGTLVFVLLYVAGIAAMLGGNVAAHFRAPGTTPRYLIALVAFWCCVQAGLVVLHAGS